MDIDEIIPALEAILFAGGQAAVGAADFQSMKLYAVQDPALLAPGASIRFFLLIRSSDQNMTMVTGRRTRRCSPPVRV